MSAFTTTLRRLAAAATKRPWWNGDGDLVRSQGHAKYQLLCERVGGPCSLATFNTHFPYEDESDLVVLLANHADELADLCEAVKAWSTQARLKSKHTVAEKELFAALARLEDKP